MVFGIQQVAQSYIMVYSESHNLESFVFPLCFHFSSLSVGTHLHHMQDYHELLLYAVFVAAKTPASVVIHHLP